MDLNHDYNGSNEFLVVGNQERMQACKACILAFGDLGYTDPPLPNIKDVLGEYTDITSNSNIINKIREILIQSQVVNSTEIVNIQIISNTGDNHFKVSILFTFGEVLIDG